MAALSIQGSWSPRAPEARQNQPSPAQIPGFYLQREAQRRRMSMTDNLELGLFLAVLIAFVICGCLVTRAPKKAPYAGPVKH
jgi:hypothetical protein